MMRRDECVKLIDRLRGDAVVIAAYSTSLDLRRAAARPLNLYTAGAMGQCSSWGLGLALGMPERKIIVLDGDGSLLMNLGSLVTIANAAPRNLFHFVCQNGCYEANGSHPIPAQDRIDFATLARGAGIRHSFVFDEFGRLESELPKLLALDGPVFATLKVVQGEAVPTDYDWINSIERVRELKAALAAPRPTA
ncbi:MAG TPA: thiamine pyrophosphate-dependent enzyme [Stellaceae bacterium]|jgi:phosphonopyruvate decarboxylase|nr:thiamine pyrophosphate-dependent enzyme [Stellaceae bacterium]